MSAVIRTPDPKPSSEESETVDFNRYKDFVREVLQVSSPAMIEFRRRTPLPVCVICSKRPERCKIEIDTYRCAICSRRRKTCSWKAEILVLETVRRFGVTEVQAEELYDKWGRGIRVDQGHNESLAVDPKPSGEFESSDKTSTPNMLRIKLYPKLTSKGHESQNQSKKRNNPESTSSRKLSNKRPRLLSDGDAGNADASDSQTEFDAIQSAPSVPQPTTPRTSTPSTPPQFVSRLSVTHLCTPIHLPPAPPVATTFPSEITLPPTSSQMDGEHQQIRFETPVGNDPRTADDFQARLGVDTAAIAHSDVQGRSRSHVPSTEPSHLEVSSSAMDEDSDSQELSTDSSRATSQESSQFDRASYFESQYDSLRKQHDLLEEQYKEKTEHLIKALAQVKTGEIKYSRLEKENLALQGIVNRLTLHVSPRGVPRHQAGLIQDLDTLKIQQDALDDMIESSVSCIQKLTFEGSMLKSSVTKLEQRLEAAKHRIVRGTDLPGHLSTSLPDHTTSDIPRSDSESQYLDRTASRSLDESITTDYIPLPHIRQIRIWELQLSKYQEEYSRNGSEESVCNIVKKVHSDVESFLTLSHSRQIASGP